MTSSSTEGQHTVDEGISVQVRLTNDDNARLEAVAQRLGCTKAGVLRFLVRNCENLNITLEPQGERA